MDPAAAILSTIGAKSAAWQAKQAAVERSNTRRLKTMAQLSETLGNFPTLIRQGQEEREQRDVQEAATAGFLERGWDGMLEAGLAVPTRYPGGEAAKYDLTFRATDAKQRAAVAATEAERDRENRAATAELRAQRAAEAAFTQGRRKAYNEQANIPVQTNLTLPAPFAPMGTSQMSFQRRRNPQEAMQGLQGSGFGTPEDAQMLIEEQNKARLAIDKEHGLNDRAALADQRIRELAASKAKLELEKLGVRRHGLEIQERGTAEGHAIARQRLAQQQATDKAIIAIRQQANALIEAGMLQKQVMTTNEQARLAAGAVLNQASDAMRYLMTEKDRIPKRDFSDFEGSVEEAMEANDLEIQSTQGIIDSMRKALNQIQSSAKTGQPVNLGTMSEEELMKLYNSAR